MLWPHWQLRWPYPLMQVIILWRPLDASFWYALETKPQQVLSLETGGSSSLTMPCMTYYRMTLRKQFLFDEGLSTFTMIQ